MKITFCGAAQTVTGSKHLLELDHGEHLLLDCGMFQGLGKDTHELNRYFGFDPTMVNHLVLSHAHIDHSGLIPKLVRDGFKGKIYCTPATYDLCEIMLADSAHIQEADIRFINKRKKKQGLPELEPLYNMEDVRNCLAHFEKVPYNEEYKINDFIKLQFTDNGHILGSATVTLRILEGSAWKVLGFTGDVGRYNSSLLKNPSPFPQVDVLLCESTYGNRLHSETSESEQMVLDAVIETCKIKKGRLIIPAFSLGRTQEIVYTLNKLNLHGLLPNLKIFVDSPLSVNATQIMRNHVGLLNQHVKQFIESREDPFGFDGLQYITDKKDSQRLNALKEPCIIISASGMAEAGRVKHHIMHAISDPINTILLVGYAEPLSLSGRLQNGDEQVRIFGEMFDVKAEVMIIDSFSAHADYNELIQYLHCQNPEKVEKMFLVHGEEDVQEDFKDLLKEKGFNRIHIPKRHSTYYC